MQIQSWITRNVTPTDYVLITGSTSGIGREYAKAFAKMGCNLICVSNEPEALKTQKTEFESQGKIKVINFEVDLTDTAATKHIAQEVAKYSIRVLINNAGFGLKGRFEKNPIESYIDIIAVNVTAPVIFTHAILPKMQNENVGFIIHVASINALVPIPNNQVYTATKAFSYSYASAVSRENKNSNIKFQLVLPGTTKTPFHDRQGAQPTHMTMLPEDVVKASIRDFSKSICIPNRADNVLSYLIPFLPKKFAMDLAAYLLKKRLGV